MLLKFFHGLFRKPSGVGSQLLYPEGKRIYRDFHNLRREQMDLDAVKVIHRLNRHNHRAYLVGGCVRDMLLGKRPKDFDVATSATPEQVRRIFSNSRSIGRRFRIVHVIFRGEKIIEVSTFRSLPKHRLHKQRTSDYLIHRDNRYGNPQEDAARRDFTINGLYFDLRNESIIDYVGGYEDIQKRCIRVVGDPNISFQEDPMRMLRAAKFSALLGFRVADKTAVAIRRHRNEMRKVNNSRLFDELAKIFRTGNTVAILSALYELNLLKAIFPEAVGASHLYRDSFLESSMGKRLQIADQNLAEREELTIVIFLSLIFADLVKDLLNNENLPNKAEYVRKRILPLCKRMQFPNRETDRLIQIYISQPRLSRDPYGKHSRPDVFRKKAFFYEAFMFFKINAIASNNEEDIQKAMFWEIAPRMMVPERKRAISMFHPRRHQAKRHFSARQNHQRDEKNQPSSKSFPKKTKRSS